MALALAFKRTTRFYMPPLRRSVARNVPYILVWWIGLCTGLYSRPGDPTRVTMIMLGGLAVLTLLRKWSGDVPRADRMQPAA